MWTACWNAFPKAFKPYTYLTSEAECSHLWQQFHKPLFTVCFVHIDAFPFQQKKPILMGWTHHKMGQLGLWHVGGVNSSQCWQQQSVHMLLSKSSDTAFARGPQNTKWHPPKNRSLECRSHWFVPTQETHHLSANITDLSQPKKPASRVLIPLICPNKRNPPLECRYHWFVQILCLAPWTPQWQLDPADTCTKQAAHTNVNSKYGGTPRAIKGTSPLKPNLIKLAEELK